MEVIMKRNSSGAMRMGFALLGMLLAYSVSTKAQTIRAQFKLDSNTINLGDQVNIDIIVEKPSGAWVEFPLLGDTLCDDIEILNKSLPDSSSIGNNRILVSQHLTVTAFDTGMFYIPPMKFVYRSGLLADTIRSEAGYLEVLSFPLDTTNTIRDIKSVYKAPLTFREILPYILLAAACGLLVWVIIFYFQKKKKKEPVIARPHVAEPPDIIAWKELERLQADKLWQQGEIKEYYSRLSDIIRTYIEGRYNIMAMEQTSYEILTAAKDILDGDDNYKILKALLHVSDLVKFAKARPEPEENMNHLDNAFLFVRHTKTQPEQEKNTSGEQHTESITVEN
jgi:hypothetical protein